MKEGWRSPTVVRVATLMVVEDDQTIGSIVGSRLRAEGHDVTWVVTGRAAMDVALRTRPELVLLDLGLPDLDGVEVCRRLRVFLPDAILVVVTARDEEMD